MKYAIEATALSKRFWRKTALSNVNLAISPGTIFALLGPNGAGKTTFLKSAVGLLRPSSGTVSVLGIESRLLKPRDFNEIAFISEQQHLPGRMRVGGLLRYCAGHYSNWDEAYSQALLDQFQLSRRDRIGALSRGGKARLRMAIAMTHQPSLILMDEMFSGLDPIVRDDLMDALIALAQDCGCSICFASHEMSEVERLADKVAFINKGRLVCCESTERLLDGYRVIEVSGSPELLEQASRYAGVHKLAGNREWLRFLFEFKSTGELQELEGRLGSNSHVQIQPAGLRQIFRHLAGRERPEVLQ